LENKADEHELGDDDDVVDSNSKLKFVRTRCLQSAAFNLFTAEHGSFKRIRQLASVHNLTNTWFHRHTRVCRRNGVSVEPFLRGLFV